MVKQLYAILYQTGNKLTKRDKLGIHTHIERIMLEIMSNIVNASFSNKITKQTSLEQARVSLEILKHLIRTEHELKIIDQKTYFRIEGLIIETSKMTNGWIKYITQNPTK